MSTPRKPKSAKATAEPAPVNLGRHEAHCTVCSHAQREEIERLFLNWVNPSKITKTHKVSRDSIYRHAHALDLLSKRDRNIRAALSPIIEKGGTVKVNVAGVVSAIAAYARINARGQWVERSEIVDLNALFERMTSAELLTYARSGALPDWFPTFSGATATNSHGQNDGT